MKKGLYWEGLLSCILVVGISINSYASGFENSGMKEKTLEDDLEISEIEDDNFNLLFTDADVSYQGQWVNIINQYEMYVPVDWTEEILSEEDIQDNYTYIAFSPDASKGLFVQYIEGNSGISDSDLIKALEDIGCEEVEQGVINNIPVFLCVQNDGEDVCLGYFFWTEEADGCLLLGKESIDDYNNEGLIPEILLTLRKSDQHIESSSSKYIKADVETMFEDLNSNALKASNTYKDKYLEITGEIASIDSSGEYITIDSTNSYFSLRSIICSIKTAEQREQVMEVSTGDIVTIRGKCTDVGEILGYFMDIDSIE